MRRRAVRRRLLPLALAVVGVLVSQPSPATAGVPDAVSATPEIVRPPSYKGTWFGTTSQGGEIDFTVNKKNRVTRIEFAYEIAGTDCEAQVDDVVRGPLNITNKRFKVTGTTKLETFTLTGRFTSKTAAVGKLVATYTDEQGCSDTVNLTWRAKKGKRPPPVHVYDGTWIGSVSLPGVDPALLDDVGGILFEVSKSAITSASVPAVVVGAGCTNIRIPGLGANLDPPVPIQSGRFSVSTQDASQPSWQFSITGVFASPTMASGAVTISGTVTGFPPFGGSCSGTVEGTWAAAKQ